MLRQRRRIGRVVIALTIAFLWRSVPRALTDEETFLEFRFNFVNPGARALGMGGAFGAVADDATSAQANPAGMRYVLSPEFFLEYRSVNPDTTVDRSTVGSLSVDLATGARNLPFLGLTSVSNPDTTNEVSFVSFVAPLPRTLAGRRVRIAVSRQMVLSEDLSLSSGADRTEARFAFPSFPNTVNGSTIEAYSVDTIVTGERSSDIVYWNLGGSIDLSQDFSAGLTLTYATLDLTSDTVTQVIDPLQLFLDPTHPRLPTQPSLDVYETHADGTDSDMTFTFGLHLHPDSAFAGGVSPWRFGAVYRKGVSFSVPESTLLNGTQASQFDNSIIVPDRYSLSASYRSPVHWLFSLEIERVEYSDMLKGFRSGVNYLTSSHLAGGAFGINPSQSVDFTVDDGFIPRAGLEYVFWPGGKGGRRLALWGGYYHMPDDRIRMERFNSDDQSVNAAYLQAFGGGEAADHFTGGVGFDLGPSSFQVAGDTSNQGSQIVGAFTYRFGTGR